jgi:hypothetical protein
LDSKDIGLGSFISLIVKKSEKYDVLKELVP